MTILYLEWLGQGAGGRTEPISLARVGPDHMQGVISFWAAVLGRGGAMALMAFCLAAGKHHGSLKRAEGSTSQNLGAS